MANEPPCWVDSEGKIIDYKRCYPMACSVTCTRHGYSKEIAHLIAGYKKKRG